MWKRKFLKQESEKVKMLSNQYGLLLQAWSENAMLFHDMGNHLQTIYHLAGEGKNEDIRQYISHISHPVEQFSEVLWTGVGIVDAVLNAKKQTALEKGYSMDINAQLPANTGIAEDDFCTILTNLLDNAIESMDREQFPDKGQAIIQVSLRSIHHFLVIRVSNPCKERHAKNQSLFATSKRDRVVADFFKGELSPDRIIRLLEEYFGQKVVPDETLLIFDEIQACERALTSLKYFCEEAPEYHVAAAGSLLRVAINRESYSFPVGKVIIKTLYPLRFDEFLCALGQNHLVSLIWEHYNEMKEMPETLHQEILYWYDRYLFIGGMPAAINQYKERESLVNVPEMQSLILNAYTADMAKYTSNSESTKIRNAFLSIPAQLAKENKKFQYKLIRKGATAGLFGDSIAWLIFSGVALSCEKVTRGENPLIAFRDVSAFKLYLSDVGLLSAFTGIMPEDIIRNSLSEIYRGALTENYVAQTLRAGGYNLYYWTSDAPVAEVDFLIQKEGKVIPIEVKSGENVNSKSLKHFQKLAQPEKMIRLSRKNFGSDGAVWAVPLYAAFCL